MSRILILSLVFPPDSVSTAQIMGDLAKDLSGHGHEVVVLTTVPHYNRSAEGDAQQPMRYYWGPIVRRSLYKGIPVYHAWMPPKARGVFLRLAGWLNFHLISTFAGFVVAKRPDVIIAPSPPLSIGVSAWLLSCFYRAPYIYNVQEIFPDLAVNLGAVRRKWLIGALLRLERFVYEKASAITVIAPRMRQRLVQKGVRDEKLRVIPNFVDLAELGPSSKCNMFSIQHGIAEKFVVTYAGNIGPVQGLDSFVGAAELLKSEPAIHFVMVGNGTLLEVFARRKTDRALANLTVLPYQPFSMMRQIYAASDVSIVPQAADTGCDAIPSKVYRIMACARPVIACTDSESDLANVICSADCGAVVAPGSAGALAEAIMTAYQNQILWRQKGQAGRDYVVANYGREVVTERYHELVKMVTGANAR